MKSWNRFLIALSVLSGTAFGGDMRDAAIDSIYQESDIGVDTNILAGDDYLMIRTALDFAIRDSRCSAINSHIGKYEISFGNQKEFAIVNFALKSKHSVTNAKSNLKGLCKEVIVLVSPDGKRAIKRKFPK